MRMAQQVWRLALWLLAACVLASASAACGLHPGGDALGFIRTGELWTIQADGSNAHRIEQGGIVGFAWSPDHHQLVYRTTSSKDVAPPASPLTGAPDAPGDLYVTSINGGLPVQISQSLGLLARSDAWWNPQGNRLLFRESFVGPGGQPGSPTFIESQADQPLGIASKTLLDVASLPTLAPDGARVAAIDADGNLRVGPPAQQGAVVATGALAALPGASRPGRVLWQPGHDALLYGAAGADGVALTLRNLGGGTRTLATIPDLLDAAFSPNGSLVLARTPQGYSVWSAGQPGAARFSWPEADAAASATWAPSGDYLLVHDSRGAQLVNLAARTVAPLLVYASASNLPTTNPPAAQPSELWRPATGSPWSADGTRIVFVARSGDMWGGSALPGKGQGRNAGLYVGQIQGDGAPGAATLIESGDDRAPSWGYADPSTTLLVSS